MTALQSRLNKAQALFAALMLGLILLAWAQPVLAAEVKNVNVLMILWRGETEAEKGFCERLEKTPGVNVSFTILNLDGNEKALDDFLGGLNAGEFDFIYTFGTTVTRKILAKVSDTPVIYNIVSRPVESGIVKSMESSGNNATGVSNAVPMDSALRAAKMLLRIRKITLVYNPSEKNSIIQRDELKSKQSMFGFTLAEAKIESKDRVAETVKAILDSKPDVVILPSDSTVTATAPKLVSLMNKHRIPTIVIVPEIVKDAGALLGIGPDYRELGEIAAQNLLMVAHGAKPSAVSSKKTARLHLVVNMRTARRLGITFPVQLLSMSTIVGVD